MTVNLNRTPDDLVRENEELRNQLREAEELIFAVRTGAVDALAIQSEDGPRIFTLEGADQGYRTLIEQMSEGAALLGQDGVILYGNAALAHLLQCGLEEVMGQPFERFIPAEFRAFLATVLVMGWHHGKSKGELPLRDQSGGQVPLILSTTVLSFGGTPVLAVIITDASAQREIKLVRELVKQQNAEITRQQQELQQQAAARQLVEQAASEASRLLEGIPQIAWTADPQGRTTYFNRRWFDYTGQQPPTGEVVFEWQPYQHPAEATQAAKRWQHSLRSGEVFDTEFRLRNHNGLYRWMLSRALPSYDEHGNIMQWIGTCTDIHEHKLAQARIDQAQRLLQENNEQLRRANVDLDNFIYTASHDLKAPINNIEGLLVALLEELPTAQNGSQTPLIFDMMQDSVDRFKRTLTHLTEVTKLQKEYAAPVTQVALAEIIQDVCLDLAPLVRALKAQVEVETTHCATVLFAEKNLRSIIYNLLSNALKYHSPERVPHIRIACQAAKKQVILTVQDNGLGLVADNPKLFAMFERFHSHVEGSGIGLYMVKKIVENAGGRIEVASEVGVGSTFSVYLRQ